MGTAIKNENRAAAFLLNWHNNAAVIVMPDLEVPGIIASIWAKQMTKACWQPSSASS